MLFATLCKSLRKNGYTLGEIVTATQRPKTSVYFHIKNVPITRVLSQKIKAIRSKNVEGKHPEKGKSLLGRTYEDFNTWTPELTNLFAHALFDGSIRRTEVLYHNRSNALLKNFRKKMRLVYKHEPKKYNTGGGVVRLAYHNVELGSFFRRKTNELIANITSTPRNCQREFLQAFFDDEGSIDFRTSKNVRRVRGYQHNINILTIVHKLLRNFSITSYLDRKFYEIIIGKRKDMELFAKEINFSKGLRVNGNRSNSIWKKSLEKREILARAIASYK